MIYLGAEKLADTVGLKYSTITCWVNKEIPRVAEHDVIYLHGGGGFNSWFGWTPKILKTLRVQNPDNLIIVGPTTVALQLEYLKQFMPRKDNLIFFAREQTTFNFLKKHFFPDVKLDHDTALHLSLGDGYLEKLTGKIGVENRFSLLVKRSDPETPMTLPRGLDPTKYGVVTDPILAGNKWAWYHFKASDITTNRSHSAILGSILGKPTTAFAGGYHKNKSIWAYSLKQRGVKWLE